MDTFPGPQPCPRGCSGEVQPGNAPAHYAWHDQQAALIAALQAQIALKV